MTCDIRPGRRRAGRRCPSSSSDYRRRAGHHGARPGRRSDDEPFLGDTCPAEPRSPRTRTPDPPARMGFFTDTTRVHRMQGVRGRVQGVEPRARDGLNLTGMSYDNTQALGADTWRHVAFIEQARAMPPTSEAGGPGPALADVLATSASTARTPRASTCARPARCSAPSSAPSSCRRTSATVAATASRPARTASSTSARTTAGPGSARCATTGLTDGLEPACAKACPTDSIQFGPLDELRERARGRVEQLHAAGVDDARLYGDDPNDGVGGDGAFFLLLDEPEVYGLPPDPVVTTRDLPAMWRHVGAAAGDARRWPSARLRGSPAVTTGRPVGREGGGAGAASSRWCRRPSSRRTTACRSSTRPCGRRPTSPATSSSAVSRARRRCSRPARDPTGRPALAREHEARRAAGDLARRMVALVHDLGRPRGSSTCCGSFKPTSPMSVGSWLLAVYGTGGRGLPRRRVR